MGGDVELRLTERLRGLNAAGGYPLALVCAADGLLVASAGERGRCEQLAGLTSLFGDIARRAVDDLGCAAVDELTVSDGPRDRLVIRPLDPAAPALFLVVQVPHDRCWRRNTSQAARALLAILRPLLGPKEPS